MVGSDSGRSSRTATLGVERVDKNCLPAWFEGHCALDERNWMCKSWWVKKVCDFTQIACVFDQESNADAICHKHCCCIVVAIALCKLHTLDQV